MPSKLAPTPIPEPYVNDPHTLRAAVMALKQGFETLTGQRGSMNDTAVTWDDLVQLGLIKPENVPIDVTSPRDLVVRSDS